MSNIVTTPVLHFEDINGMPLVGGKLYSYEAGSSTPLPLYMDEALTQPHPDPIVLDMRGECKAFYDPSLVYKLVLKDSYENIIWEADHLTASGSGGGVSNIVIEGTPDEIEVEETTVGLVRRFVIKLSSVIKNKLQEIQDAFAGIAEELNGKKDKQLPSTFSGSTTKTVTGVSQNENGELDVTFEDIEYPDYDAEIESLKDNLYEDGKTIAASLNDLNARLGSVEGAQGEKNIGDRTADSLDAQALMVGGIPVKFRQEAKSFDGATNKTVTNISQDENGVFTVTYSAISLPDYEKIANKKTSVTGNEGSNTYYPTIKALVDYIDSRLQNLGGKKITNNGVPFTSDSQLPTTTPYYGQNINSDDYAYVQDTGLASRYTAIVTGSSVAWSLDYEIAIPVFTAEQQNAIDSGITSEKVSGYDSHVENGDIHVTASQKNEWSGKQDALSTEQMDAVNSGITSEKVSGYDSHVSDTDIHVTTAEKNAWDAKQNAIADLSDIRDGASKGDTAVQPEDLATYMTNPVEGGVIAAALNDLNARLNALEYEDENIGDKIADKFDAQILRCGGVDVKTKQAKKDSPSASGTSLAFIDSISQNENGEMTATKKNLPSATTMQQGVVQLNNTVTSTSQTQAATANALKTTYDLANGKQNPIGINSSSGDESLFLTQKGSWLPTPNEIVIIDNTYDVDSVLSLISAGKTPVYKHGANYLYNLEKYQESGLNRFVTFTQSRIDDIYVFGPSGIHTVKVTYIYQSTVTTSGWSNDSYYTYGNESLVSSIASPYIDDTHFPTTKAVSDFVDQAISGVGGKQITNNGSPFTSSASLPSSTPYGGQNIASNDYAYVQHNYTITRYVASVNGSSVTWSESFSIDTSAFLTVPIDFTEAQTVENINANETLPTILGKIKKWFTDKISHLGNLAFLNQVGDAQISGTINDSHIASANTWNNKQNALPTSGTPSNIYAINVSGYADHALKSKIACGTTSSSAASITKSVYVTNNIDYSEQDFLIAVTFVNGNSHENYIELSFDNVSYTVTDGRVKWIRAGMTYLFALNTMTTSDGKFVGDLITMASFAANARGTTYTLTDNQGLPHTVDAYPYQSPTNIVNTFRYNTQSFKNGIGSSLTKILMLNESGGVTLNWAQYPEPRFDFIDMTIRVCGFYNSTNAISEVITVEPYKYVGSYISAGLPELSSYILLLNDGVNHPFTFTVHLRMSYKEFLSRIGGTGTTLNLGFTFIASTSSSNKHSITFANIWTSVTYHGDRS